MKKQGIDTRRISVKDRDLIISRIEGLTYVGDLRGWTARIAASLAVRAMLDTANHMNPIDLEGEAVDITLIMDLLIILSEVQGRSEGALYFPEVEEFEITEGKKFDLELTPRERADVERWRLIERSVEGRGDKNDLEQHRKNLKVVFEAAGTDDPLMQRTFEALDTGLEADICYLESLTSD